jgi:replicative DNA helicase
MADDALEIYQRAQRSLVASLIFDGSFAQRVFEVVEPDDFEEPHLFLLIETILELTRRNVQVGTVTVASELELKGNLKKVGGPAELFALAKEGARAVLDAPPEIYALVVKEAAVKRKVSKLLDANKETFVTDSGVAASEGVSALQAELTAQMFRLGDDSTVTELSASVDDYFTLLEERKLVNEENRDVADGLQGIPSSLPSVNKYTTGFLPGQLITVGARTGVGKSVFAVNSAVAAATAGKSVMFFSLEMSETEIQDRIFASMSGIPMNDLKQGKISDELRSTFDKTSEEIRKMKLLIDVDPKVTPDSIRAKALRRAQSEDGLDFIIVDYLQLMRSSTKHNSRQEEVAEVSRNMKLLSKQLQVPVMVLVQLKRSNNDDDENGLPRVDDIRESGAIGQDSDIVILLHRDVSLDDTIPQTLVIIAKNRNGEAGKTIRCHSNLACSSFNEVVRAKDVDVSRFSEAELHELAEADDDLDDDFLPSGPFDGPDFGGDGGDADEDWDF